MQSRRDQVQAYSFVVGRLTSGMLGGNPDAVDTPATRTRRGAVVSAVLSVLLCLGFLVYGLLVPGGSDAWREPGAIIVEKETGARFLYSGGSLRPVLNYTSAKLATGAAGTVTEVSAKDLSGTARGTPIGIPGVPDSLPAADALRGDPWQVCATSRATDDGKRAPVTSVGVAVSARAQKVPAGGAVLAEGPHGKREQYLLWRGKRLRLPERGGARQALGFGTVDPVRVDSAFLSAVPAGPDVRAPEVPARGDQGPELAGKRRRVGELFAVRSSGSAGQHYVLGKDGLVPLTPVGYQLLRADPGTREKAYGGERPTATVLDADETQAHLADRGKGPRTGGLPTRPPRPVQPGSGSATCLRIAPHGHRPQQTFTLAPRRYAGGSPLVERAHTTLGCPRPGLLSARPGAGVLAAPLSGGRHATTGAPFLVTGDGTKYPLAARKVSDALGYGGATAVPLPAAVLRLLPTGPRLDPAAAARPPRSADSASADSASGDRASGDGASGDERCADDGARPAGGIQGPAAGSGTPDRPRAAPGRGPAPEPAPASEPGPAPAPVRAPARSAGTTG